MPYYSKDEDLSRALKGILESWPLYRVLEYSGSALTTLPKYIGMWCPTCKNDLWWERIDYSSSNERTGYGSAEYRCRNCTGETVRFYLYWKATNSSSSVFFKVGQFPPPEERIPRDLEKQLVTGDLEFYKRAIRCRNFGYGLAALAYLRRAVENQMNQLLDLIAQSAKDSGFAEDLKRLDEVKRSRVFDDKITYAAGILPPHLRPGGHNPIDRLHDIASEGIHSRSDDECIDIFDRIRLVFEYLFIELNVSLSKTKEFASKLNELTAKREKK